MRTEKELQHVYDMAEEATKSGTPERAALVGNLTNAFEGVPDDVKEFVDESGGHAGFDSDDVLRNEKIRRVARERKISYADALTLLNDAGELG